MDARDAARIGEAIAGQTRALHLGQHLGSRFWQVMSPMGVANTPGRRALAAGAAVVDVTTSRWFGPPRRHLALQAAIDLVDQALWSALANDEPESSRCAFIPGATLAAEAGARWRLRAVVLPAAHVTVAAVVRRRRGHSLRLGQVGWQLWGIVGSLALSGFGQWRRKRVLDRHLQALQPALVAAEIAGMNEVGAAADNLLDATQRVTTLVELTLGSRGQFTGGLDAGAVKQEMAQLARAHGGYLGDVLLRWQAAHNATADLRRVVSLRIAPDAATRVLAPDQVRLVEAFLDRAELAGRFAVELRRNVLSVGHQRLQLPDAPAVPSLFFDPIPIGLAMHAAWMAAPTGGAREHLRWSHAALPVAVAGAAAAVGARQAANATADRADRSGAVGAAGAALGLYALLAPRGMRQPTTPSGVPRYPFTQALQGYLMIVRLAEKGLSPQRRLAAWGFGGVAMAGGLLASRRPWSMRHLAAELVWPITTAASSAQLAGSIDADSEAIRAELTADDAARIQAAHDRGRARMLDLVRRCLDEATSMLAERSAMLPASVADEARRRLHRAREEMAGLQAQSGAPSLAGDEGVGDYSGRPG